MQIQNNSGLRIEFHPDGAIKQILAEPIRINLKETSPFTVSGSQLYLRKRGTKTEYTALSGPLSNSKFNMNAYSFVSKGEWEGIEFACSLQLSPKSTSWQWNTELTNKSNQAVELDLIYVQDVGLKASSNGLINEYYVSQYLERMLFTDKSFGEVICCRQNMKESTGYPWLMIACKNKAISGCTDGIQFYGTTYRETGIPEGLLSNPLGGNLAGESPVTALQETPFTLQPGASHSSVFAAKFADNHPEASSPADLEKLPALFNEFASISTDSNNKEAQPSSANLFHASKFLPTQELSDQELNQFFGSERRHVEYEEEQLLSFFSSAHNHVVLKAKEIRTDRPHGHIMQAQCGLTPDNSVMSTTAFAFGVFHSHISQGNTNFNVLLSVCTSQFNLSTDSGQRIFIEMNNQWHLLGVPSAFEMGLNHCRWYYKTASHLIQITSWTSKDAPAVHLDVAILQGKKTRLIITHDFDPLNQWQVTDGENKQGFIALPAKGSLTQEKFPDAQFRFVVNAPNVAFTADKSILGNPADANPLFVLNIEKTDRFCMSIVGEVDKKVSFNSFQNFDEQIKKDTIAARNQWKDLSLNLRLESNNKDIQAINEILPWYGMNALTHFLTPYGLEQFSGAAWGTRDVSQGPVDLLLTMEKYEEARKVLEIIFSNQNTDGGWPQWWMFDSYNYIRAKDSHGDVYYWVIIALSDYIKVTSDYSILDMKLPYFNAEKNQKAESTPISEHLDKLIQMIMDSFIPGTSLVPFGGGDWNDSLQPVSHDLAERMISSWTVEMNYQAFTQYSRICENSNPELASKLKSVCKNIKTDFNKYLVKDGVIAGYGLVEADNSISILLHPSDSKTGIKYGILPMDRGIISDMFSKEQAHNHQVIIDNHLKGPDGARLMNKPLTYKGGIQSIFQRAESSTFFGREIGLMYIHEHIRYAESQAKIGHADNFIKALRQAIPVNYQEVVFSGDIRQSNCYYSSSDAIFKTRYEADEKYTSIMEGKIPVKGGWRVYSSGPGIYVSMIVSRLLGIRKEFGKLIIDPVLNNAMNGLTAKLYIQGKPVSFIYKIESGNYSPKIIRINGTVLNFSIESNQYRKGGAVLDMNEVLKNLDTFENKVEVIL